MTYEQLSDLSNRAAIAFERSGLKKGDKVMIQLPRVNEWVIEALFEETELSHPS